MRLVFISDTHSMHNNPLMKAIPDGDILVHCGDLTKVGLLYDVKSFADFMKRQNHKHKVIIAGNHDYCFEDKNEYQLQAFELLSDFTFLQDKAAIIEGIKFYGSPWQPEFMNWAFNLQRDGIDLMNKWAAIPDDTEILLTHGPPFGVLDMTLQGEQVGCEQLERRIKQLKYLQIHAFGHIHEAYGVEEINKVKYINACICNRSYQPMNKPIVIDLK